MNNTVNDRLLMEKIYPLVEKAISKRKSQYKLAVSRFIHKNHDQLYDYAPVERIYFKQSDIDDYFKSLDLIEKDISNILSNVYYYNDNELAATKDTFSIVQLLVFKYFAKNNNKVEAELAQLYLAFSGKYYASVHYNWFTKFVPKREVMDYVVNNMLSNKFSIITEKSLWGAVRLLTNTWSNTYKKIIDNDKATDEELKYIIHQLYERLYTMIGNIAKLYYKAVEDKLYLNYENDNYDQYNFRISPTTSSILYNITEKTMIEFTSTKINVTRCYAASTGFVNPIEIKSIFENIISKNSALDELREVINTLLVDFVRNFPNIDPNLIPKTAKFIDHSIKPKPNMKQKDLVKMKDIILSWLNTSEKYRKTKTPITITNYYKAILIYISLTINSANK